MQLPSPNSVPLNVFEKFHQHFGFFFLVDAVKYKIPFPHLSNSFPLIYVILRSSICLKGNHYFTFNFMSLEIELGQRPSRRIRQQDSTCVTTGFGAVIYY